MENYKEMQLNFRTNRVSPRGEAVTTVTDEVQFTHNLWLSIKHFIISKRATTQGRPK